MPEKINNISTEAAKKATGKGWDEWITLLDKEGAGKMSHKEIARYVAAVLRQAQDHSTGLPRASVEWWCQMVTVG